jgi:hypothetical protein
MNPQSNMYRPACSAKSLIGALVEALSAAVEAVKVKTRIRQRRKYDIDKKMAN